LGGLQRITAQQFSLHRAFEKKNLLCITGCGSTPGIANVMAHYGTTLLDSVQSINLGFAWDSKPKIFVVPYSLQSIFAEFQEKPVVFEKGVFRTRAPYELIQTFRQIGPQRIKGIVHSEVYTFPRYFPSLRSVRYFAGFPEHSRSYIEALRALQGDKDHELPYTLQLLKKLIPPPGYKEWEVIWVKLKGMFRHKPRNILMECFIRTQKGWEDAGSNIGTGRTISVISQMLAKGEIHARGVHAPEGVVPWKPFFAALHTRGMFVYCNGKRLRVA
jgi:saccharopine dehydrogenase-like NADP-dependent oxidoreductase